MSQRVAILISAVLTAFVLVLGGGLVGRVTNRFQQAAPVLSEKGGVLEAEGSNSTTEVSAQTSQDSPEVLALLNREAEYQELIRQANQRLQSLYAERQALASQAGISPSQAMRFVQQALPGAVLLETPRLVSFKGQLAYELELQQGMVYIEANTGNVLFSSIPINPALLPSGTQSFIGAYNDLPTNQSLADGQNGPVGDKDIGSNSGAEGEHEDEHDD